MTQKIRTENLSNSLKMFTNSERKQKSSESLSTEDKTNLAGATAIWVLSKWLSYHFLTLVCLALILGLVVQFVWSNASGLLSRSPSEVPRLVLADEFFVNVGVSIGVEVNRFLQFLHDVANGDNFKQFIMVVSGLCATAVIGSWFDFVTVLYIGFVAAHTLPVLYERYEDQVDYVVQDLYRKLEAGVVSKILKGEKKHK